MAQASLPTRGSIYRQYGRAIGDVEGFSRALVSLLREEAPGITRGYDEAIGQQRAVNTAAEGRLRALGPEYAVAPGAAGDAGMSRLLAQRAAAGSYAGRQPGIAASRGALAGSGLVNARGEALRQRAEAFRPAFYNALQQVQQAALARATAGASIAQSDRSFAEQVRQFNAQLRAQQERDLAESYGALTDASAKEAGERRDKFQDVRDEVRDTAMKLYNRKVEVPVDPRAPERGTIRAVRPVPRGQAFNRLWRYAAPLLRQYGYSNKQIRAMVRNMMQSAGYRFPKPNRLRDYPR